MEVIYWPGAPGTEVQAPASSNNSTLLKPASISWPASNPVVPDSPLGTPRGSRDSAYRGTRPNENSSLNARQRKQVYMSSSLFDNGGPRGEAIYTPSRQNAVFDKVQQALEQPRNVPDLQIPNPKDFRATVNAGHGVVSPSNPVVPKSSDANGGIDVVSFGGGPDVPIVRAVRDEQSIPREFWATSTHLKWWDVRAETCGAKRQGEATKPAAQSPDSRKRRELSSEVLGSERRMQKSTSSPSHDIWSQHDKHFNSVDSRLGPRTTTPEPQSARMPLSARDRRSQNLTTSSESQFTKYPEIRKTTASESPGPGRTRRLQRGRKYEDDSFEDRRRAERNYSDLFGKQANSPSKGQPRQEMHATTNCHFLDQQVEIATRNQSGWSKIAPTSSVEASRSKVLPGPKEEHLNSPMAPEERAVRQEERACWDTSTSMTSGAEIARRSRNSTGRRDCASPRVEPRSTSASERKRLDLSSGQFRKSNDLEAKCWDDGRPGPGPAPVLTATPIARNNASLSAPWRNVPNDSAKQRRIISLMSSVTLH